VMPLVVPDNGAGALQALEYLDAIRENRTGYTRAAQGMKSGSLATGTLGELNDQISQSGIRLEMIARTIAETGLRDLFRITHALTLKHSSRAEKVRLRNVWHVVNPREWVRRTDLSISVGLGSTTGPQQLQNLMMLGQAQQQAMPLGLVTPENVYNTIEKMAVAMGFKNPEAFITKPKQVPKMDEQGQPVIGPDGQPEMESAPPPENKDPIVQAEEVKGQIALQKAQMEQQAEMPKAQMEVQKAEAIARIDAESKITIARFQAEIEAQTKLQIAQIEAGIRAQEADQAHEREYAVGMEKAKNEGRPQVQIGNDDVSKAMSGAAEHLRGQGDAMTQALGMLAQLVSDLKESHSRPRTIVRGKDGRAVGLQ
jgi:hypothetical protein